MTGTVELERRGKVAIIRLNRPGKLNSINTEMVSDIVCAFDSLEKDSGVRAVIVTGNGKAFSAGADVLEMSAMAVSEVAREGHLPLWNRIRTFRKPLIAALNGLAAGGGLELAMACDIAIASRSAMVGQTEINLGIMPGAGGTQRLARAVGKQRAMEMVLTGKLITAEEAVECGLVLRTVDGEALLEEALKVAESVCSHPAFAVELAKESINAAFETLLQQGLDFERRDFCISISQKEGVEGMKAFIEKRKPEWAE